MKKLILSSFALVAFVFVSNSVSAQTSGASALAVTIPTIMTLDVTTGTNLALSFADAAELTTGKELENAVTLNYKSNKRTYVNIQATNFASTAPTGFGMDASIIRFKTDAVGSSYTSNIMSNSAQLLSGAIGVNSGNAKGDADIIVSYKVTPTLQADPAAYSTTITYTITAN